MRRSLSVIGLAAVLAACAAPGAAPPAAGPDPALERSQRFAQRACAGCHDIGPAGESPRSAAPAFERTRLRYTAPQLERRLADISEHGHYEMPPIFISADEARDLVRYIESLGR